MRGAREDDDDDEGSAMAGKSLHIVDYMNRREKWLQGFFCLLFLVPPTLSSEQCKQCWAFLFFFTIPSPSFYLKCVCA